MYLNREQKRIILCMSAVMKVADVLKAKTNEPLLNDEIRGKLSEIATLSMDVTSHMVSLLEEDQIKGILRLCNSYTLCVLPETDYKANREYFIIEDKDIESLIYQASGECQWCDCDPKKVKNCKIRKALLNVCYAPDNVAEGCPYKHD